MGNLYACTIYEYLRYGIFGEGFWTQTFDPDGRQGINPFFVPFHTETYYMREIYDTPLFNGDTSGNNAYVGTICINGKCSDRNDLNYVAQGMWSAAAGETSYGAMYAAEYHKQKSTIILQARTCFIGQNMVQPNSWISFTTRLVHYDF